MRDQPRIDLNADVGEGYADADVYPHVTSVNIACGAHAGDEETMVRAIDLATSHGCAIGAHPGYADRERFGRRDMTLSPSEIAILVATQVHDLAHVAKARFARLRHVKPHGALYNQASSDYAIARAIATAVAAADDSLVLVGRAGSALLDAGAAAGLQTAAEAFCDRGYRSDGSLVPRGMPGDLITDPAEAASRAVLLAKNELVPVVDGEPICVSAATLCIHADTPGAGALAAAVRSALDASGILVSSV